MDPYSHVYLHPDRFSAILNFIQICFFRDSSYTVWTVIIKFGIEHLSTKPDKVTFCIFDIPNSFAVASPQTLLKCCGQLSSEWVFLLKEPQSGELALLL